MAWFKKEGSKKTAQQAAAPPKGNPKPNPEQPAKQAADRVVGTAKQKAAGARLSTQIAAHLGCMATLLMRSPEHRKLSIADMQWLLLPPLMTGQYALVTSQGEADGQIKPTALVLWAKVSEDVDKRLTSSPASFVKLEPAEWRSGDFPWVVAALGDRRIVQGIFKRLWEKDWKTLPAKAYAVRKDGTPIIVRIGTSKNGQNA